MTTAATIIRLQRNGILMPRIALGLSRRTGLGLAEMCAMLRMETGGGRNVYGHDPVRNPIHSPLGGSLKVTQYNYLQYKHYRILGYGMQGVGPVQLTWYSYQDLADKYGGCWDPTHNIRVGAEHLRSLIHQYGTWGGFRSYNGAGAAATAYANVAIGLVQHYRWVLAGAKVSMLAAPEHAVGLPPIMAAESTFASEDSFDNTYISFDFVTGDHINLRETNGRGH